MQFENVIMLTDAVKDILKAQKYCWLVLKSCGLFSIIFILSHILMCS